MRVGRKPVTCDEQQRHMSPVSRKKSDVESSSEQIQNNFFERSIGSPDPKKLLKCPSQALHVLTLDGKGERETPDERGINTEIKKLDTFLFPKTDCMSTLDRTRIMGAVAAVSVQKRDAPRVSQRTAAYDESSTDLSRNPAAKKMI